MTLPLVGDMAPDFSALLDDESTMQLSALRGSPVVLFFYPKDDTPGCTTEACGFQAALPRFTGVSARILGVSPDSPKKHVKFREKFGLAYPLVSDPDHSVSERYGVWSEKSMYGRKYFGVNRTTFVIDADGRISHVFEKVKPSGHAEEVADAVMSLSSRA